MPNPKDVLRVLEMTEEAMMDEPIISLYQAFYALPTRVPPIMCNASSGKGFEGLNEPERQVAERIVRVVMTRCPPPTIVRWHGMNEPAANDPVILPLRITHH